MKRKKSFVTPVLRVSMFCLLMALVSACSSYKKVPYFQNLDQVNLDSQTPELYDAHIMPKDILTITVNTTDPTASAPFNLTVQTNRSAALATSATTQPTLQQYLVNNEGVIEFPVLGSLQVGGLTKNQAESMIREKLMPYLNEVPVVTVRMSDFKISVLGEVTRPGQFSISKEKVNVLEALALAGDMTVYGVRDDVQLIRENASGKRQVYRLDLNDANIIVSPYYQMQQNDILYVKPNKTKARNSDLGNSTSFIISSTSILLSFASLMFNIFK